MTVDRTPIPIVRLGDVLPRPYKNGIYKSSGLYGRGTPILRITDFDNDGRLVTKKLQLVSLDDKEIEAYKLSKDDIVINRVNSLTHLGKAILWSDEPTTHVYESNMMRVEPDKSKVDPHYLIRVLHSYNARVYFQKVAKRAVAQCSINQQDVKSLKFLLPPLSEQIKIAQILFTWDKAITITEQLLANSQQQKKALMQQLLTGQKRFSSFTENWQIKAFDEVFTERVETFRIDLPLLSITADSGVLYQKETGRKNTSNDDKSKYKRLCVGDIGYNTMRMWQGRSSLSDKEGIVSPAYTVVTPDSSLCPAFISYLFKLPKLVHIFYRRSQGLVSDTWNLKFNHFKKIRWEIPTLEEQQKIATVLVNMDGEIKILQSKVEFLKSEKIALMQQLLTGKLRVKLTEEVV